MRRSPHFLVSRPAAAAFGLLLGLAVLVLVVPLPPPLSQPLQVNDIAPRTLVAAHDASFVSQTATEAARQDAADTVAANPQRFARPPDPAIATTQLASMDNFLSEVANIRKSTSQTQAQKAQEIAGLPGAAGIDPAALSALAGMSDAEFTALHPVADTALTTILARAILPAADPQAQVTQNTALASSYLSTLAASAGQSLTTAQSTALQPLLAAFIVPTSKIDEQALKAAEQQARENTQPIIEQFSRGQVIVVQGEQIKADALQALHETGVISPGYDYWALAGGVIMCALLALGFAVYVWRFQPFGPPVRRRMLLVGLSVLALLILVRVLFPVVAPDTQQHYFPSAIPVAAVAMIAGAFGDLAFATFVAVAVGLFAAFAGSTVPQLAGSYFTGTLGVLSLAITYVATGLAGAICVSRAQRLGRYALAALVVAFVAAAVLATFWLIGTPRSNVSLAWIALASGINGLASSAISLTVFVLLAMAFGVTTRLQLLELTQADHPLLRRLQDEAPGTYHHSMLVGSLAERGADRIGADSLLARVGAYYHDIGKLAHPHYYVENMLDSDENPHDSLSPVESAAIIREHVTAGVDIARRYHLPDVVRTFIPEHHGTRLVTFFYRQATASGQHVDPAPFRYAGPRPRTRESAIVMLADSCEAVVRARQGDLHDGVEPVIDAVFAERLAEGQLDDCDITLHELQEVAAAFKATLRAIYHPRVPYPDPTPEELAGLARGDPLPARDR